VADCAHLEVQQSRCVECGACLHEAVLNGACYYCGAVDIDVTVKPAATPIIPADRLVRDKDPS
jgi:DNA polymerase II large subunit